MKAIKQPTASVTRKANARLIKDAARNKGEARRQLLARLAATVGRYRIEGAPNLRPGDVVDIETPSGRKTMVVGQSGTLTPLDHGLTAAERLGLSLTAGLTDHPLIEASPPYLALLSAKYSLEEPAR